MNLHLKTCAVARRDGEFYRKDELYLIGQKKQDTFCIVGDDNKIHWVSFEDSNFNLI